MSDHDNIGTAILAVMNEVGYVQKETSDQLRYSYASEAALIRALRPAMLKHGVFAYVAKLPEINQGDFTTAKGYLMNHTTVHGIVRFSHPASDTSIDVHATGEGMDAGDKSGNKALTGLLKYALRQTFLIETGDDPDASSSDGQQKAGSTQPKRTAKKSSDKRPQKVAEDAVTQFWNKANHYIKQEVLTREQAQEIVNLAGGNFVEALDRLTAKVEPPDA